MCGRCFDTGILFPMHMRMSHFRFTTISTARFHVSFEEAFECATKSAVRNVTSFVPDITGGSLICSRYWFDVTKCGEKLVENQCTFPVDARPKRFKFIIFVLLCKQNRQKIGCKSYYCFPFWSSSIKKPAKRDNSARSRVVSHCYQLQQLKQVDIFPKSLYLSGTKHSLHHILWNYYVKRVIVGQYG